MYYEPATPITLPLGAVSIHRGAGFELSLHSQRQRLRRGATRRDATRRVAGLLEQRERGMLLWNLCGVSLFPADGIRRNSRLSRSLRIRRAKERRHDVIATLFLKLEVRTINV